MAARTSSAIAYGHLGALLATLHERVKLGDSEACEIASAAMLRVLPASLRRVSRTASHEMIMDAVGDAILDYVANPNRFNSAPGTPLTPIVRSAAYRNLLNAIESERRRRQREAAYAATTHHVGSCVPLDHDRREAKALLRAVLPILTSDEDRKTLRSILAGNRSSAALAVDLGFAHLSIVEQRRAVKRVKDRITKRVRRSLTLRRNGATTDRW